MNNGKRIPNEVDFSSFSHPVKATATEIDSPIVEFAPHTSSQPIKRPILATLISIVIILTTLIILWISLQPKKPVIPKNAPIPGSDILQK